LADAAGGVGPETIGFEEVHRSTRLRSLHILGELASKTGREQHSPVSASLPLHDTNVALIQVHILQPYAGQFAIPQPREDQHLDHDHVLRVTGLPDVFPNTFRVLALTLLITPA
jgi:hypothetical protein